jgi:hypothetical protein
LILVLGPITVPELSSDPRILRKAEIFCSYILAVRISSSVDTNKTGRLAPMEST